MKLGLVAAVVLLFASGCSAPSPAAVGGTEDAVDPAAPRARVDADHGGIFGFVSDDSLLAIPDAQVVIEGTGLVSVTDSAGRFSFSLLIPGTLRLFVSHPEHESSVQEVSVEAGEVVEVHATLLPLPSTQPYSVLHQGTGRIMCGVAARPGLGVGVCQILTTAVGSSGDEPRVDIALSAQNLSNVATLFLETTWQPSQFGAGGLHVTWEHAQDWDEIGSGPERRVIFGQVNGHNPLRLVLNQSLIAGAFEGAGTMAYCSLYGPCTIMGIGYAHSATLGASSPADAGAYLEQSFTHFVTEFFGAPAPEGYTAILDS